MTILGLGTDVIEIERIRSVYARQGDRFLHKCLSPKEIEYCLSQQDPIPRIAGRFAAKEAIAKALGTGFGEHLSFLDLEIVNEENGKPSVFCSLALEKKYGKMHLLLSISHSETVAMATALWIKT